MAIRFLLISSLIMQLAFSFQCCSLLVINPALLCPEPAGLSITIGWPVGCAPDSPDAVEDDELGACGMRVACGATVSTTADAESDSGCSDSGNPCGLPANEHAPDSPCDDEDCDLRPPLLPAKMPDGKDVVLTLPVLVALLDRSIFLPRPAFIDSAFTTRLRWRTNHARQAWLERWLN